jgi:hypothetical protein
MHDRARAPGEVAPYDPSDVARAAREAACRADRPGPAAPSPGRRRPTAHPIANCLSRNIRGFCD